MTISHPTGSNFAQPVFSKAALMVRCVKFPQNMGKALPLSLGKVKSQLKTHEIFITTSLKNMFGRKKIRVKQSIEWEIWCFSWSFEWEKIFWEFLLDSDHTWPKPVHGALWLPETRIISCPVAPHISCHLQPAGEGRKHILSSWFSCGAHICWPVQSNILQIMPTIGKDGEIKFRFDFCLLIGFLGLTASLAHTIVNINLRDTEYNLCEHVCCTLEHNDPTRTYCLIAWTRSTMFSLPQVLQAQCLVSLKCKVNHTCLATSQCQQGNLTILLPTFGQIVWFNWKKNTM